MEGHQGDGSDVPVSASRGKIASILSVRSDGVRETRRSQPSQVSFKEYHKEETLSFRSTNALNIAENRESNVESPPPVAALESGLEINPSDIVLKQGDEAEESGGRDGSTEVAPMEGGAHPLTSLPSSPGVSSRHRVKPEFSGRISSGATDVMSIPSHHSESVTDYDLSTVAFHDQPSGEDEYSSSSDEEGMDPEEYHETILASQPDLMISHQYSTEKVGDRVTREETTEEYKPQEIENPCGTAFSESEWLEIAAKQIEARRSRKAADIELRKKKYPELFRSDVSICPSYTDFKLPEFVKARKRAARALRVMNESFHWDIQEMALLQPCAFDGVRVIRTFSQGASPMDRVKDPLSPNDRFRLEQIMEGRLYP